MKIQFLLPSFLFLLSVNISVVVAFIPTTRISTTTERLPAKAKSTTFTSTFSSSSLLVLASTSSSSNDALLQESTNTVVLSLSLSKPFGLILEEIDEGKGGVYVKEISADTGSAAVLSDINKQQIIGSPILSVQGNDVRNSNLDTVINTIVNAPDVVTIEFAIPVDVKDEEEKSSTVTDYDVGTRVTIQVRQKGKADVVSIQAKVGDNLRTTLLENGIDVYEGMKQKLGNCGGAGQCTFCAFDFIDTDGWVDRSEYEDQKIRKFPIARLTCLNNIMGPATISKTQR